MSRNRSPDSFEVAPDRLRRVCSPASFDFESTAELPPLSGLVGQLRALQGLRLAIESTDKSFHGLIVQPHGTSRSSALMQVIKKIADRHFAGREIYDYCYVHNFDGPDEPRLIMFPKGKGNAFEKAMAQFGESIGAALFKVYMSKEYEEELASLTEELAACTFDHLDSELQALLPSDHPMKLGVKWDKGSIDSFGLSEGNPRLWISLSGNEKKIEGLNQEQFKNFLENIETGKMRDAVNVLVKFSLQEIERAFYGFIEEYRKRIKELDAKYALETFDRHIRVVFEEFDEAKLYLEQLRTFVVEDPERLLPSRESAKDPSGSSPGLQPHLVHFFEVNVVVDNSNFTENVPVIWEDDPSFGNLIGRISRKLTPLAQGAMSVEASDHTQIEAGSLARANGGVLIIPLWNFVRQDDFAHSWKVLIGALRNEEIIIEDLSDRVSLFPSGTLKLQAIPLQVRVILLTDGHLDMLFSNDPLLGRDYALFRSRAEFVRHITRNKRNEKKIAQFLRNCSEREGIGHCDSEATALLIEYASWLAEDRGKLTLDFTRIKDVLLQASYWAGKRRNRLSARDAQAGKDSRITARDVRAALKNETYRSDAVREYITEAMQAGTLKIAVRGQKSGSINALSIVSTGSFSFGRPVVVSASTSLGKGSVVSVEREVEMADPIFQKSVYVISGYLKRRFGRARPLSLHAQIVFEQMYGNIDGDSASVAELYVVLSDLTEIPLEQGIAITGSCNQHGDVQAVGGVNVKIEGFYDVCKALGNGRLTGTQGVIIPRDNVRNLMLREDIVEAVRAGRFHIWGIGHVDDGIEIMTGMNADAFNTLVEERLDEFAHAFKRSVHS